MAMKNPYNYSMPKSALKLKANLNNNKIDNIKETQGDTTKNKMDQYKEQKIMTAKPEELTLMLYEGLIKFLKQAKLFIKQRNIEKTNNSIIRSQDIINELNITLNMDYEISRNLRSIYVFMNERLIDANINKDEKSVEEVLGLAQDLKDTWKEAMGLAYAK
ncbi:flagellar export chaperone FliS [Maledivibacter halophilus]|uniref:Flagellar protein FliS n=1 Tax=Maledivibacter halophilus TaxID=36842 RepID=A0A1T5JW74_9FIRM|nr:flagellar export chaperone FliS [Maledivibacter halophilus]SKC55762.1 flagellar protein FliS [Maledivibacter halophilus]